MTQDAQVCHGLIPVVPISKILAGFDQPQRQQHRHDRQARHLSCADIEDKYRRKIVTRGGNGRASAGGHRDLTSIMFVCIAGPENKPMNPATGTREFALRDPDGYYVMVNAL